MFRFILLLFLISGFAYANQYGVYAPDNYHFTDESDEKILFILDFSNSMNETIGRERKVDLMIKTFKTILPKIKSNALVGLRVYGYKMGFSPYEACHASKLLVPLSSGSNISGALDFVKPRGMTPITYSLKQAVKNDFMGYRGKKRIILITDGGENCDESPCAYVMELVKVRHDISIDVIALTVNDEDDLAQLECAALVTRGKFYTANTAAELVNSLNKSIDARKDVDAKIISNY